MTEAKDLVVGPLAAWQRDGHLLKQYENLPRGLYVTLVLLRETESEAVFRTEGSGEPLTTEFVTAGVADTTPVQRVVMTKRKQTAVERRSGREVIRAVDPSLMQKTKGAKPKKPPARGKKAAAAAPAPEGAVPTGAVEPAKPSDAAPSICMLNTNDPCERCIDCWLYGYAAGGGGAQKSRVLTEDAFSLLPSPMIVSSRTFNATYEDGTMRNPVNKAEASRAISESEFVHPGAHFLDVEVLKDVQPLEVLYVLGNIFRSTRYGAISSRIGRMRNELVALALGTAEGPSSLELTQVVHDALLGAKTLEHPLPRERALGAVRETARAQLATGRGIRHVASEEELASLKKLVHDHIASPEAVVRALAKSYPGNEP